jgi:hypothetical protein
MHERHSRACRDSGRGRSGRHGRSLGRHRSRRRRSSNTFKALQIRPRNRCVPTPQSIHDIRGRGLQRAHIHAIQIAVTCATKDGRDRAWSSGVVHTVAYIRLAPNGCDEPKGESVTLKPLKWQRTHYHTNKFCGHRSSRA